MVGDLLFCRVFLGLVCISVLVGFAFRLFLVVWFSGALVGFGFGLSFGLCAYGASVGWCGCLGGSSGVSGCFLWSGFGRVLWVLTLCGVGII